jgi:hypothetical protein
MAIEFPYIIDQRESFAQRPSEEKQLRVYERAGAEFGRLMALELPGIFWIETRGHLLHQNPGGSWTMRVFWEVEGRERR